MTIKHRYLNKHNAAWLTVELLVLWALAAPPIAKPWYDSLLFQSWLGGSTAEVVCPKNVEKQVLKVRTKSGNDLCAWYFHVPNSKKTVLICKGNGGTITDRKPLIEGFFQQDVSVLIFDYAGYGLSTGKPSVPEILDDGDSVYDFAINHLNVAPDSIVLVGESIGSAVACYTAAHRECNSLILLSPFCSLLRLAKSKLPWLYLYPAIWFPDPDLDNRVALSNFDKPVLIIYGAQDKVVPPIESRELARTCRHCETVEIPDRGHLVYYPPSPPYQEAMQSFLR